MKRVKPWWESRTLWAIAVLVILAGYEPITAAIETGDHKAVMKAIGVAVVGGLAAWARQHAQGPLSGGKK